MKKVVMVIFSILSYSLSIAQDYSFNVEKSGKGTPILMIPGLSSSGEVWDETVSLLKDGYECHVVTLPGFAGQPSIDREEYLKSVGDELVQYIQNEKLKNTIVMGHSLGGFLTLYIGLSAGKEVNRLVVVDGLAYMGAAQNPAATPESMKDIANMMRKNIEEQSSEQFEEAQPNILQSMISSPDKVEIAMEWGRKSDRKIVAQAMYELFQWDLRNEMSAIEIPTLILGSWAGYKNYGVTKDMVERNFQLQFVDLKNKRIILSEEGKHFIMWDDPTFFQTELNSFLNEKS